jgi:hypothetical protein
MKLSLLPLVLLVACSRPVPERLDAGAVVAAMVDAGHVAPPHRSPFRGPVDDAGAPIVAPPLAPRTAWISTIQSFLVTGGGTPIENVQAPGALASTFVVGDVNGPSPGGSLTFLFDGTKILVTGTV